MSLFKNFIVFLKMSCTLKIPDIVNIYCHMKFGPSVKLHVVPLAGRCNSLDLASQLPPVAVHVLLGNKIISGILHFDIK